MKISLCDGWRFSPEWSDDFMNGMTEGQRVRIPHSVKELPLHYASNDSYEMICGYRRTLTVGDEYDNKRLFLQFDGAAHIAQVYVNGSLAGEHRCGYTAFRVEITDLIKKGENTISVRLDCTENPSIPPFGFVIDYLTYGGLYREVWLDVRPKVYIEDVWITTPTLDKVKVKIKTSGEAEQIGVKIFDPEGNVCAEGFARDGMANFRAQGVHYWSIEDPDMYTCEVTAGDDVVRTTFGVRTVEFKDDGFYLNGKKTFLYGLNRHQCWPYIGYAAPESLQREDARILKSELGVNAVRTSHYPQSHHFIDECDRLGICVFTELPGWQHIGDEAWKDQACENVREMIMQYRNHPSIVLWGVRINESQDDDEFYRRTNAIAHELDPTRPTTGVRYLEKSSMLEDVYAFNDFSHTGDNGGVRNKRYLMDDTSKPLLISEHNGHMFPTKACDPWQKRQSQALRHGRVLNDAMDDGDHVACFGWCMFDYNTHKDFGSGDRICYHGVMDSFRNPKLASALYASQSDSNDVLEIGSSFDKGDYAGSIIGDVYAFTNADEVRLYKNDDFVMSFTPDKLKWGGLSHPPILIDDFVGDLLMDKEGFPKRKSKLIGSCLTAMGRYGAKLPAAYKAKIAYAMARYRLSSADGRELYLKYIENWGGEATRWRFDAVKGGKVVKSVTKMPGNELHFEAKVGNTLLREGDTYDMTSVRIRLLDELDNIASYAQVPVRFAVSGEIELVGPDTVTAEGGMCGTYIRTTGRSGKGVLTVSSAGFKPVEITITVKAPIMMGGINE